MDKRIFQCWNCGNIFSTVEETTFSEAKPGEYWNTAQGYVGKCPKYTCYAHEIKHQEDKKEEHTMQVSYNGFTGELLKLERHDIVGYPFGLKCEYDLSIYDSEKRVTHSFTGIKLEDVKFLSGVVVFDG